VIDRVGLGLELAIASNVCDDLVRMFMPLEGLWATQEPLPDANVSSLCAYTFNAVDTAPVIHEQRPVHN
jgi:hypothetical protein